MKPYVPEKREKKKIMSSSTTEGRISSFVHRDTPLLVRPPRRMVIFTASLLTSAETVKERKSAI